jgi:hypothetical protein
MFFILSGVLIFLYLGTINLRNKKLQSPMFLLAFMWMLYWANLTSADYDNYSRAYEMVSVSGRAFDWSQFGFIIIFRIFTSIGLTYNQTLAILSFVGLSLIWSTINRFSPKPQFATVLYFIYPFLLDIVQVKHFLAMSIVIYCIRFLLCEKNSWRFLLGVIIASSIHIISLIYIPFIFIRKIKHRTLFQLILVYLIIMIPLSYTGFFRILATLFVAEERIGGYFDNRARLGFFIQFFIQGLFFITIHFSRSFLIKNNKNSSYVECIYRLNLYLFVLFPLYVINMTFSRGFRIILIPNYIVYSIVLATIKPKGRTLVIIICLSIVVLMFLYRIYIPHKYSVLVPILSENMIVKYFS